MGSKNLKAIAVKGSGQPGVADHQRFLAALDKARTALYGTAYAKNWAEQGTARAIVANSNAGTEAVRNYREGVRRVDDRLPDRFFKDAFTIGPKKGSVLDREKFDAMLTRYYKDRGWDSETTKPGKAKLQELGLNHGGEHEM